MNDTLPTLSALSSLGRRFHYYYADGIPVDPTTWAWLSAAPTCEGSDADLGLFCRSTPLLPKPVEGAARQLLDRFQAALAGYLQLPQAAPLTIRHSTASLD